MHGDYVPPPPPPPPPYLPLRDGGGQNGPPLRSTQYPGPAYSSGPANPYQTSPYGYQAPSPSAAAPQSIPYFPPPPTAAGRSSAAPAHYRPPSPTSSAATYSGASAPAAAPAPQQAQVPAWYHPQQASYAPSHPAPTPASHPPPAQSYHTYYAPPTTVQYGPVSSPATINPSPTFPSYQAQYGVPSPSSIGSHAPAPPPVPIPAPYQQQQDSLVKPQEQSAPPVPPPWTRPVNYTQESIGQQQGYSHHPPPVAPPSQPAPTTLPESVGPVQPLVTAPQSQSFYSRPQEAPEQKQTTSTGHYYYPPPRLSEPPAQAQDGHVTQNNTASPNDHYYYPPPTQAQGAQGNQGTTATTSSNQYSYSPPPPPPPGPPPSHQIQSQHQSPNPGYGGYTSGPATIATVVGSQAYNLPTPNPLPQQELNVQHPKTTINLEQGSNPAAVVGPQSHNLPIPEPPSQQELNVQHPGTTVNFEHSSKPATETAGPSQTQHGVLLDSLTSLSAQMNSLNVRVEEQNTPSPPSQGFAEDDRPREAASIQATGTPCDIIPYCPERRGVHYSLYWYRLADVPAYLICTRCHADHIQGTALAGHFERVKQPDGVVSSCGFWYPRVKEVLWPQALRSNNVDAMSTVMKRLLDIPPCKDRATRTASEGIKWYGMKESEIDGFLGCEACYEHRVVGTAFESRFIPYREQGADDKWVCDLAIPYVSLAVVKMSKQNDWSGFVAASLHRLQLPQCDGKDVESNSRSWYLARRKMEKMHVCEACYLDKLALTRFGDEFEQHVPATGFDAFLERLGQRWTCNLANGVISMTVALDAAIYQRDFNVFWQAAEVITGIVPCTEKGIIRGNWWTVRGGCDGLSVCEACHAGILQTTGIVQFFEPVQRDREATIVCSFCTASPRFGQFISKYAEAIDRSVFSYYTDYIKELAGVPTCPGIKSRAKSKWWGYPEALCCQDCYMTFMKDTSLGDLVPVKEEYDERAMCCQLWSPRMRNRWLEVCAAGKPGDAESEAALKEFREFGTRRMQVYNATVPQIEFIQGMRELKMMNAMHQGMLSVMYSGMNSFASVAGTTDGNLHGNSSLGWYETENGATGAQMLNNMQSGMADANRADEWVQIAQLQAMWNEVE